MSEKHLEEWGEKYNPGIQRAGNWDCPACGKFAIFARTLEEADAKIKFAVGYSKNVPNTNGVCKCGGLIFRCPECCNLFWIHVSESLLEDYSVLSSWRKPQSV